MSILDPNISYSFSKYFELGVESGDLATEFGYSLERKILYLPQYEGGLDRLRELRDRLEEILPYVPLTSELARREILISRIVTELVHYTHSELRIEFPLKVSDKLQGSLDYLLKAPYPESRLLVIEAKYEDLTRGFSQLVAEMIALDKWLSAPPQLKLVGAVSTGTIWQFAQLDRSKKYFEQSVNSYRVPEDVEQVLRVCIQALKN